MHIVIAQDKPPLQRAATAAPRSGHRTSATHTATWGSGIDVHLRRQGSYEEDTFWIVSFLCSDMFHPTFPVRSKMIYAYAVFFTINPIN
jgi:hypothetical protein